MCPAAEFDLELFHLMSDLLAFLCQDVALLLLFLEHVAERHLACGTWVQSSSSSESSSRGSLLELLE